MKIPPATAKKFHSAIIFYPAARFRGGLVAMGKQCACGATQGWRETGSPAATTYSFCFAMRVGLAPAALHTACGCLWVMENNAPAALHGVGGETGSPAATTYSFCFAIRVVLAPTARHTACGCLWENNAPAALHKAVGKPMAPTRGAYIFFVLPSGWHWPRRSHRR